MTAPKFQERFDDYVCTGDRITVKVGEYTVVAHIEHDDYHIDNDDVHNPDQSVTGCDDAQHEKLMAAREAWAAGEWFYCGVVLNVHINGVNLGINEALWGIECNYPDSDNSYLTEVANELLPEALAQAQKARMELIARLIGYVN